MITSIVYNIHKNSNNTCPTAGDTNNGVVSSDWKVILIIIIIDNFVIAIIVIGWTVIVLVVIAFVTG